MEFNSSTAVLQAKLQAWCVNLLSILVDAYQLGAVLGRGAVIRTHSGDVLSPDVMFVAAEDRKSVGADAVRGAPPLAIDIIYSGMPEEQRADLRRRYAAAHVLEYWQIEADNATPHLYQASAGWTYDVIPPDKDGMHFSTAMVELSFPVLWFRRQPSLWSMMEFWGMIHE
jgi:hypothetical protein